jgi:hypothetical protein
VEEARVEVRRLGDRSFAGDAIRHKAQEGQKNILSLRLRRLLGDRKGSLGGITWGRQMLKTVVNGDSTDGQGVYRNGPSFHFKHLRIRL